MTQYTYSNETKTLLSERQKFENDTNIERELSEEIIKYCKWASQDKINQLSTDELRKLILTNEQQGKTGFDCGWSYLVILNNEKNKNLFKDLKQIFENDTEDDSFAQSFKKLFKAEFKDNIVKLFLRHSLFNVQSLLIQEKELNKFLNEINPDEIKIFLYTHFD